LRGFQLPGGEAGIREPWRCALGILFEIFGEAAFGMDEVAFIHRLPGEQKKLLAKMLSQKSAPWTTSAGRLFDGVAALSGLCDRVSFEGQAAMSLEFALSKIETGKNRGRGYALKVEKNWDGPSSPRVLDWEPMIRELLADRKMGVKAEIISLKFHRALAGGIVKIARELGEKKVVLSGGCFQNKHLAEETIALLRVKGYKVFWHQSVPPNDGGIALGQLMAAQREKGD
jgi:hydrogenase maturation protein HypF